MIAEYSICNPVDEVHALMVMVQWSSLAVCAFPKVGRLLDVADVRTILKFFCLLKTSHANDHLSEHRPLMYLINNDNWNRPF